MLELNYNECEASSSELTNSRNMLYLALIHVTHVLGIADDDGIVLGLDVPDRQRQLVLEELTRVCGCGRQQTTEFSDFLSMHAKNEF